MSDGMALALVAIVPATLAGIAAVIGALNRKELQSVHKSLDGKLRELILTQSKLAAARGYRAGKLAASGTKRRKGD